ncbi:MAG: NADH-quinone oxidoreductase subunit C [Methanoculleaceae archaeon]
MSMEDETITGIAVPDIISTADRMKEAGWRLAAITAARTDDSYDLTYSFGRDGRLCHYRVRISPDEVVPSISGIYPGAFVYENEIHDLFGIEVHGLRVDYGGTFIRTSIRYPFGLSATHRERGGDDEKIN